MNKLQRLIFAATWLFAGASSTLAEDAYDPIEPVNRGIFWFNNKFDYYLLEPASKGYDYIVPDVVQEGVGNFFTNLKYPMYLVSDLLQLKFKLAARHTGRFVVNTTVGIGGVFDVAEKMGMNNQEEDVGQALGYYGVPSGPYIMLPFLGPSNLRDTVGYIADSALDPVYYAPQYGLKDSEATAIQLGAKGLYAVDKRAKLAEAIKTARDSSLDYYLFVQSAYYQYRRGQIYDGNPPVDPDDEQYEDDNEAPNIFSATKPKPKKEGEGTVPSEAADSK